MPDMLLTDIFMVSAKKSYQGMINLRSFDVTINFEHNKQFKIFKTNSVKAAKYKLRRELLKLGVDFGHEIRNSDKRKNNGKAN